LTSGAVRSSFGDGQARVWCDLVPKSNTEEVPNEEVPTRYLAAVPQQKYLLWEIVWPQREGETSHCAHAHYGALRFRRCPYRSMKSVCLDPKSAPLLNADSKLNDGIMLSRRQYSSLASLNLGDVALWQLSTCYSVPSPPRSSLL
jgi:hypothetical protein